MNNKNIIGNGSKATLPGGQKLSDKIQENKIKNNIVNNASRGTNSTSTSSSDEQQETGNQKSSLGEKAQAGGTAAAKEALKRAAGTIPYTRWIPKGIRDKIIDKFMDSGAGQEAVEKGLRRLRIKLIMMIVAVLGSFVIALLNFVALYAMIAAPVGWIADVLGAIGDFFASVGNWFAGNGWCASEGECQQKAEYQYYEKLNEAVNKYSGSCEINEDLITATIFYGQMVSEDKLELDEDGDEESGTNANNYFNYLDVSKATLKQPAKSQVNKLIKVYLKGEDLSDDEKEELADKDFLDYDQDDCAFSAAKYKDYLIDTYIDWAYPDVKNETRTKEKIADEILAMGNIYIGAGDLTIVEDTDGLFTMLPSGLNLGITSQPASCRCHPTKEEYQSHRGVDIGGAPYGTSISAFDDGTVDNITIAATKTCGSSIIRLKHTTDSGEVYYTRYVHLNRNSNNILSTLTVGTSVSKGQVIGYVGGTAVEDSCSTGPHLHFEVHNSEGKVINPVLALNNHKNGLSVLQNQELITECSNKGAAC